MSVNIQTPQEIMIDLARRAQARRLELNLTQVGLAERAGVSLGSVKRFERLAEISLRSLVKMALVLDALDDFTQLFQTQPLRVQSLDQLLKAPKDRKRGRRK